MIRREKRKHCVRKGKPLLAGTSANQELALDLCTTQWNADERAG
jgi:hypothetical protein